MFAINKDIKELKMKEAVTNLLIKELKLTKDAASKLAIKIIKSIK